MRIVKHFLITVLSISAFGIFATAQNSGDLRSFAALIKRIDPAVVTINVKETVELPRDSITKEIPKEVEEILRKRQERAPIYSAGSGFIVDTAGYVVTNKHVVSGAKSILVSLVSGESLPATLVGTDEDTDIAVLKIDSAKALTALNFGDSDKVEQGDWVLALGSPFGLSHTVTAGIVSSIKRETPRAGAFKKFIQTDAAINRGNSGGPLINDLGEVIGVNSMLVSSSGESAGVGFALPSNETKYVYEQIRKNGRVRRGYLGVSLESVKPEFGAVYGVQKGAIVLEIRDTQAAGARAGLRSGDIITEIGGQAVENAQDLIQKVAANEPATPVEIAFVRQIEDKYVRQTASVTLSERPTRDVEPEKNEPKRKPLGTPAANILGLKVESLASDANAKAKFTGFSGVIVREILPESLMIDVRDSEGEVILRSGDVIERVNKTATPTAAEFEKTISLLKKGDAVVLWVRSFDSARAAASLKVLQFTIK